MEWVFLAFFTAGTTGDIRHFLDKDKFYSEYYDAQKLRVNTVTSMCQN